MPLETEVREWVRDGFYISTDKSILSLSAINSAFGEDFIYWTKPLPNETLQLLLDNSFCFGVYKTGPTHSLSDPIESTSSSPAKSNEQIGFARLITDNVSFAYLTDLYVLPEYQGHGLGGWLIDCINEIFESMPYLRWAMLRTSQEESKKAYKKRLQMKILVSGEQASDTVMMGKRGKGAVI